MNSVYHPILSQVRFIEFSSAHSNLRSFQYDFRMLNEEWLNKYFTVEPLDKLILEDPESYILNKGGFLFFAEYQEKNIGTCALINEGNNTYELAKLAVTDAYQGNGLGKQLCMQAIKKAMELKAKKVYLVSSTKLIPALRLYEKLGFKKVAMTERESEYKRADIKMLLELD